MKDTQGHRQLHTLEKWWYLGNGTR